MALDDFQELGRSEAPSFYANAINVQGSAFDILIEVGARTGPDKPELKALIWMSYEHAKVFAASLSEAVERYEAQFEIQIPELAELLKQQQEQEEKDRDAGAPDD